MFFLFFLKKKPYPDDQFLSCSCPTNISYFLQLYKHVVQIVEKFIKKVGCTALILVYMHMFSQNASIYCITIWHLLAYGYDLTH